MTKAADQFANPAGLTVVEGIGGTWYYHLRIAGQRNALCGNSDVMLTHVPLDAWGVVTHLHERYCTKCEALAVNA